MKSNLEIYILAKLSEIYTSIVFEGSDKGIDNPIKIRFWIKKRPLFSFSSSSFPAISFRR